MTVTEGSRELVSQKDTETRRALILAGGGLKVAFQAGVLQVWLDEARADGEPIDFMYADAASGGVFNLAMRCQGLSGTLIAENWRALRPLSGLSFNVRKWLPRFESAFTYDRFRQNVLRELWDLDWPAINDGGGSVAWQNASFNLFNVATQQHEVVLASEMNEDALISAVSLPFWYPPVQREAHPYIDAVYATDANLEQMIRAGANELWIVWTVSQRGVWAPGPIHHYFQVIEAAANSRVRAVLQRIEASNAARVAGRPHEFADHIKVRWLSAEVPLHYLFDFTRGGMRDAVDRGVAAARRWVDEQPDLTRNGPVPPVSAGGTLAFSEYFRGSFGYGTDNPVKGAAQGQRASIDIRVSIPDLDLFGRDPNHAATFTATVDIPSLGPRRTEVPGQVQLFCDQGDFRLKQLTYVLSFKDLNDDDVTVVLRKYVPHRTPALVDPPDPYSGTPGTVAGIFGSASVLGSAWVDTTTLYTWFRNGNGGLNQAGAVIGAGKMRVSFIGFLRSLASTDASPRIRGLAAYGDFFQRQIRQAYRGPGVEPSQPPAFGANSPPGLP